MAIPINEGGGGGFPFAKFTTVGQELIGAIASDRDTVRQVMNAKTKELETKTVNGVVKPKLEEVMYFIAMPGTTAVLGSKESGFTPIEPMSKVRFSVSGYKWKQVIDARNTLPAHAGYNAGQECSSDVYTIKLVSYSASSENPSADRLKGFTVTDDRIVIATPEDFQKYVLEYMRQPGKDYEITARRIGADEKPYEQAADAWYLEKPWKRAEDSQPGPPAGKSAPSDAWKPPASASSVTEMNTQSEPPF